MRTYQIGGKRVKRIQRKVVSSGKDMMGHGGTGWILKLTCGHTAYYRRYNQFSPPAIATCDICSREQ